MSSDTPKVLDRQFFLTRGQQRPAPEALFVPEWGGVVHVRRVTAGEYDAYIANRIEFKGQERAVTLAHAVGDESGAVLFDVKSPADRAALAALDNEGAERVTDEFMRVNGLNRGN